MGALGIVGILLYAIATIAQGISSHKAQQTANQFNQDQYEDWKSYNTPLAQMERLGDAGLNPYMVNGVNNTLSQPFSIGQNTGLSEMFSNMSLNLNRAVNNMNSSERNQIGWENATTNKTNAETRQTEAKIHQQLANLRADMVDIAKKRNDPMMALLWGQANYQDIQNGILQRSADSIVQERMYDAALRAQRFDFLDKYNPMALKWYEPVQRARVNQMLAAANLANRQASHLDWLEPFQYNQYLHNFTMDYKNYFLNKEKLDRGLTYDYDRLALSHNYFDLAENKFWKDLLYDFPGWNFVGKGKLLKSTRGGAGQFPSWTEYEYGW